MAKRSPNLSASRHQNLSKNSTGRSKSASSRQPGDVRIIGGTYRGRKLHYPAFSVENDPITRPMKHRVREALFNLIGLKVVGRYVIDLFAGTRALCLEAISRGAVGATFIEKHVPTARVLETNIANLGVEPVTKLRTSSAFLWVKRDMAHAECGMWNAELDITNKPVPWVVFCSPPYAFYGARSTDMLELIATITGHCPDGSLVVVEADERFDFNLLPGGPAGEKRTDPWQVRIYPPAVVWVWRKSRCFKHGC